jgi:hypothetical protein
MNLGSKLPSIKKDVRKRGSKHPTNGSFVEFPSIGGFPLEEASEIFSCNNKCIIFWINCVIVPIVSLFMLIIVIKIVFILCVFPCCTLQ